MALTCSACTRGVGARAWCYECAEQLCAECDARLHADNCALDTHRRPLRSHHVEHIEDQGGATLLLPALDVALLAGAGMLIAPLLSVVVTPSYFLDPLCPAVTRSRCRAC